MMNAIFKNVLLAAVSGFIAVATVTGALQYVLAAKAGSAIKHTSVLRIAADAHLPTSRTVRIALNKSMLIEIPRSLRDVVVSNPEIVDAVVQSSNRVYLIAKKQGQANAFFFDSNGNRVMTLEITVERDTTVLSKLLGRLIPGSDIDVEILNQTIVLTGVVRTPADASMASKLASRFVVDPANSDAEQTKKVINLLAVQGREQVLLKVTVAEIQRDMIKRLGVNWSGAHIADSAFGFKTNNAFPLTGGTGANTTLFGVTGPSSDLRSCIANNVAANPLSAVSASSTSLNCLLHNIEAFERNGVVRTLAEPTLTAISGETASFLAGGEFPIPVDNGQNGISIQFKQFGIGLSFSPLVLSASRISMKIKSEVSELSNEGAIQVSSISIPSLKVRRSKTTVELPSGGSLVIAGLISDDTRHNIDGVPGLKKLPILGTLFRSKDYKKRETELVIIVTPYMVKPVSRKKLGRPDDGLMSPSDPKAFFLGHFNRIYGTGPTPPAGTYKGDFGFIIE